MRIVVTGSRGLLGRELVSRLADRELHAFDLEDFDITDLAAAREALSRARPDAVIHAGAWTDVDGCEAEPDRAMSVNAFGAKNMALAARDVGASVLLLSTDYVFDGTKDSPYDESDSPAPRSAYGRSKLLAEKLVTAIAPRWTVFRTQALFGAGGRNFVDSILAAAEAGRPLRVVGDQWTCPTYAPHLAAEIVRILDEGTEGLYHVSAKGACTWLELARAILDETGRKSVPVEPVSTEELARPAPRPRNGVLRNMHLELTIGDRMPEWREGLRAHLRARGILA